MPLPYEKGVFQNSELYEATPSRQAQKVLYYIQRTGHFYCDARYMVKRDFYPGFLLAYVIKGSLCVKSKGEEASINEGECCLLDCRIPHQYNAPGKLEYLWIHINGANIDSFCSEMHSQYGLKTCPDNPEHIQKQMEQILSQFRTLGYMEEVAASRKIHELLCGLLYETTEMISGNPLISEVQRYLAANLQEELSVTDLAEGFHLSSSQLNRLFKLHTGQTPHEYLVTLRINRAKTLLKETQQSITEIAGAVGYSYDTSFSAAFRARTGLSPRRFRETPV